MSISRSPRRVAGATGATTVLVNRTAQEWHAGMKPRRVAVLLALATALSVSVATVLHAAAPVAPVWAALVVLLVSFRFGPKGVVPAAAGCGALGVLVDRPVLGLDSSQTFGIIATGYLMLGLTASGAFYLLFRRLQQEHDNRITEVESERNRALSLAHERETLQEQLAYNATHDGLTGLANRVLLLQMIEATLAARRADGNECAVLFLDLDDFKTVNDTLGHGMGDRLLEVVAERLGSSIRHTDLCARLGGDEFAVLFPTFDAEASDEVVRRVLAALSEPARLGNRMVNVRASAGLVVSGGEDTALGILGKADLAMYSVKARGKADLAIFRQEMQVSLQEQADLERDLQEAVGRGEIVVYYQPIVDLRTGRLAGFEALSRWMHHDRGLIFPDLFIPMAEETGAICRIGEWVLEQACRQLRSWQHATGNSELTMAVNVSPRQLNDPDFVARVADVVRRTAVDPRMVTLEITESMVLEDDNSTLDVLWRLRALGTRIAVDDFGTGYSSLSRLSRLPMDKLKIDKSFTMALGPDADGHASATLIAAAVAMAHGLGVTVVAEGVEAGEHVGLLRYVQCEYGQGYLFGKPTPADGLDVRAPYELVAPDAALLTKPTDDQLRVEVLPSAVPVQRSALRSGPAYGRRRDDLPLTPG